MNITVLVAKLLNQLLLYQKLTWHNIIKWSGKILHSVQYDGT